jgi:membrane associated rhomboid family serine protease
VFVFYSRPHPSPALVVYISFVSHGFYTVFAILLARTGISDRWANHCVAGFSGVLFGLSAVMNSSTAYRNAAESIFHVRLPLQAALFELAVAQLLVPNASFAGHLCGVLAGFSYVILRKVLPEMLLLRPSSRARAGRDFGSGTAGRHDHAE